MTTIMAFSSHEQSDSKSIDQDVLSRIQHLNVTERIIDKNRKAEAYGGYSEVFRGCLRRDGNVQVDVAIKRLRFHTGEKVLKARYLCSLQKNLPAHAIFSAICQRGLRMVKIVPPEHFTVSGLRYLRGNRLSLAHF